MKGAPALPGHARAAGRGAGGRSGARHAPGEGRSALAGSGGGRPPERLLASARRLREDGVRSRTAPGHRPCAPHARARSAARAGAGVTSVTAQARRASSALDEGRGERTVSEYRSEIRDGMRVDWDVPVPMDDGVVLRCDVFRPIKEGRYPVRQMALVRRRLCRPVEPPETRAVFDRYHIVSPGDLQEVARKLTGTFSGASRGSRA